MIRLSTHIVIGTLFLSLAGCGIFSFSSDDDVDVLIVARSLLKDQTDEHGDPKKVTLPVRVNYTFTRKPMIDEELLVEFEFITKEALPILRFAVTTTDGLELVSNNIDEKYQALKTRQVIKSKIKVIPTSEKRLYVNLFVVTEVGEDKKARQIKIPVPIGDYFLSDNPPPRQ